MNLTPKQHELMLFLQRFIDEHGFCPSFTEMQDAANLASKSGIHRLLCALEERGFISRIPHRSRSLSIVRRAFDPKNPNASRDASRRTIREALQLALRLAEAEYETRGPEMDAHYSPKAADVVVGVRRAMDALQAEG